MSTYHDQMAAAQAIVDGLDRGDYDDVLGITPEQRDVLTRAEGDGPITIADTRILNALGRHDLTTAAYEAGRINLEENE